MTASDLNVPVPRSRMCTRGAAWSRWVAGTRFAALWTGRIAGAVAVLALLAVALPGLAGYHNVTVTGGSMGSALPVGSVAVTRSIDVRDVRIGDVIAFKRPGSAATVVNRVVGIHETAEGPAAVTRGDTNAADDPKPLLLNGTRGDRVMYYLPVAGFAFVFVRTPGGIIALTVAAVAAFWLRSRGRPSGTEVHATPSMAA